jgi:hypothetical protein
MFHNRSAAGILTANRMSCKVFGISGTSVTNSDSELLGLYTLSTVRNSKELENTTTI